MVAIWKLEDPQAVPYLFSDAFRSQAVKYLVWLIRLLDDLKIHLMSVLYMAIKLIKHPKLRTKHIDIRYPFCAREI